MNGKEALKDFIRSVYPMHEHEADTIVDHFSEKEYAKNDYFLAEGHVNRNYAFLEKGFMRAYAHDVDGNEVTTAFYGEHQVVCELSSFFKRIPSEENIQALTNCTVYYITFDELQVVFHAMPHFREFGRLVLVNAYTNLKQRMYTMLKNTAEERYANLVRTNPKVFQHAPLKYIATYLGITDTSLSRIRKEFAKNG